MSRISVLCILVCSIGSAEADHFAFYHPRPVIVAPVVAYQPAYIVPVNMYAVTSHAPVTTVTYATSYYAPLIAVTPVAAAPVVYSPPVYVAPVSSVSLLSAPVHRGYYGRSIHSHLNVHRNGTYNYHVRVR